MPVAVQLASLLIDIEVELRQMGLWQAEPPSQEALASTEPFCIDTLSFPQWLQFIFVARLSRMVDEGVALPASCNISPMAEEYFKSGWCVAEPLLDKLRKLDALFSLFSGSVTEK